MERKELLRILESVKNGIAAKELVESMTYFFFSGKDVITYNDQISIQHPFKTDFTLFVKADQLLKIVTKSKADEIFMKEKNGKLLVKAGKLNASLATIQDEEIIIRIKNVAKSLKKAEFKKLADNFCECIQLCSFAASKNESDETLTCIKIDGTHVLASDNRRIAHAELNRKVDDMFLKASEVNHLVLTEPTHFSKAKAWLHFKSEDDCIFSIRIVKGGFPDFLPLFDFEGEEVTLPKSILEGMDLTSIFTDESSPMVTVDITKGLCVIKVSSESGKAQFKSKIKYKGNPINFKINPEFLKEMMKHSTTLVISDKRAKLKTENFSLVAALFG